MADLRISELPVLLAADAEANDDIAVADYSASETRRLTIKGAVQKAVSALIDDNIIPGAKLVGDSVTATQIAPNAITASELADTSVDTAAIVDGAVTDAKLASGIDGAKLTADSVTATQIAANAITASELANDAVDTAAIVDLAVTNAKLATGIDGAKLIADSVTATQIAANAITASELANNSVDTAAIVDLAVTTVKLADASVTTAKLASASVTADAIAANAVGASELADNAVDTAAIVDGAVTEPKLATASVTEAKLGTAAVTNTKIADATVAYAKLNLLDGDVPGAKLTSASVTATQLATNAVTTLKVADAAITDAKIALGVDGGKLSDGTVSNAKLATGINGAKLTAGSVVDAALASGIDGAKLADATVSSAKLATGIDGAKLSDGTVSAGKLGTVTDRGLNQTGGNIGHINSVASGIRNGITFDAQGHITATSALVASDLPIATESSIGGVSVPNDSGLTVTALGALDHQNNVTGATINGITYDDHGHIVSASALTAADLPIATETAVGGVSVPAGSALTVNFAGDLEHENSTVVVGTYTKVAVDQKGHVTAGSTLTANDVPDLDASKIVTGTFGSSFLAENSVTATQLADNGIAQISETAPNPEFAGQWWVNPSDRTTYIWVGQVGPSLQESNGYWLNLGYGNLQNENLRFAGAYNASGNTIATVTQYSTQAGLNVGDPLSAPSETNNGLYYIVTMSGFGTGNAPATALEPGDWVVSLGQGTTWERLDFASAVAGVSDDDVLVDGPALTPAASGIATQQDFNENTWARVQVATTGAFGIVRASSEVAVASGTGIMSIGTVDDGTY